MRGTGGTRRRAAGWLVGLVLVGSAVATFAMIRGGGFGGGRRRGQPGDGGGRPSPAATQPEEAATDEAVAERGSAPVQRRAILVIVQAHDYSTPIVGAAVRVTGLDGRSRTALTNIEGKVRFQELLGGPWRVGATAAGHAPAQESTVPPDIPWEAYVDLVLEDSGPLQGTIVDASTGQGIAGARVTALDGGFICMTPSGPQRLGRTFGEAQTDRSGAFRVEGVPIDPSCAVPLARVEAPGYRTLWKVAPRPREDSGWEVRLVPGGTIEGIVTAPDGSPVGRAEVYCALEGARADPVGDPLEVMLPRRFDGMYRHLSEPSLHLNEDAWALLTVKADAKGHYVLPGLGLGERYVLVAAAKGYAPSVSTTRVRVLKAESSSTFDLRLRAPSRITVRCRDREGAPWPLLRVRVGRREAYRDARATGFTDSAGVVSFDDLAPGEYEVDVPQEVNSESDWPKIQATAGDFEVAIRLLSTVPLPPEERASRPIPTPAGLPEVREFKMTWRMAVPAGVAPPTEVQITTQWGAETLGRSAQRSVPWNPDATGAVPVAWKAEYAPHYRIRVEADGLLPITKWVDATDETTKDLGTLTFDAGEVVAGSVRQPDGSPLSGVLVWIRMPPGPRPTGYEEAREGTHDVGDILLRSVKTTHEGAFRLGGLPKGTGSIWMSDARFLPFASTTEVPASADGLRLVVRLGGILRVQAVDADGLPAPRWGVTVRTRVGGVTEDVATGCTDVEGMFKARLSPGTYEIDVGAEEGYVKESPVRLSARLGDGETQDVRVVVPER